MASRVADLREVVHPALYRGVPETGTIAAMKMQRDKARLLRGKDPGEAQVTGLTPEELLGCVWELTQEAYGLAGDFDPQSRLQRDVVSFTRRRRDGAGGIEGE